MSLNRSVNFWERLGGPRLVLFVKNPTLMVFASGGMVAPLNDTCDVHLTANVLSRMIKADMDFDNNGIRGITAASYDFRISELLIC
jgi:hypothetical protein